MVAHFIDPHLYDSDDDAEDLHYKTLLRNVVVGTTSPATAAVDLDSWIVSEANSRRAALEQLSREDARKRVAAPDFWAVTPDPSRHIAMVFRAIVPILQACPPKSAEQARILAFLKALKDMPRHTAPAYLRDVDDNDTSDPFVDEELWPFGGNWLGLAEIFKRSADYLAHPYSDIETPNSDARAKWINLQSAMAQLSAAQLVDCSFLCALRGILPSGRTYPDLGARKIGGPHRIGGDLLAGAHWLLDDGDGDDAVGAWMYAQCREVESLDPADPRATWSMESWREWKAQMEFVAGDGRFADDVREVARAVGKKMLELEASSV